MSTNGSLSGWVELTRMTWRPLRSSISKRSDIRAGFSCTSSTNGRTQPGVSGSSSPWIIGPPATIRWLARLFSSGVTIRLVRAPILYIITATQADQTRLSLAMDELTPRQQQILQWIREQIAGSGLPPTRAEICRAMGFRSPNAAEEHLRALARKGVIEMLAGGLAGHPPEAAAGNTGRGPGGRGQPSAGRAAH